LNPANQEFNGIPNKKEHPEHFQLLAKMNAFVIDDFFVMGKNFTFEKDERENRQSSEIL
jgi:hypothetical protein